MPEKPVLNVFWFRRDLRIDDNAGLFHALKSGLPVLPVFIFDTLILEQLDDRTDARVNFIHNSIIEINESLKSIGSSILVKHTTPELAWKEILDQYNVKAVYTNNDYEPYAIERDRQIESFLFSQNISFHSYKDQVIFEKSEIAKDNDLPYTVFTAYKRKWLEKLNPDFHLKEYPTKKYFTNFYRNLNLQIPSLEEIGFSKSTVPIPNKEYNSIIDTYNKTRDIPSLEGTAKIGIHLRFGTLSIRRLAKDAWNATDKTWLSELIWRDFYAMILWHFPYSSRSCFRKEFDNIHWRNNEEEFNAWCEGKTGYPIVDAGMRQLSAIGWMHNRVRMITASFLSKHLLIDWRWGEAYFAKKLIDYDMASNVGGWQWAAGTGNDAAPYFRVFSPELQTKRFDPKLEYVKKWVQEFGDPFNYPKPIVDHKFARDRVLKVYKEALIK